MFRSVFHFIYLSLVHLLYLSALSVSSASSVNLSKTLCKSSLRCILKKNKFMPLQISIPAPCHEDWNDMTPADKGRHCSQCSKTVVDFTGSAPQEIAFYISQHKSEKLCGRFKPEQIEEPLPTPEDFVKQLSYFRLPMLKKIAAIFLFAFSVMATSCNDDVVGKVEKTSVEQRADSLRTLKDSSQTRTDTALLGEPTMGQVNIIPPKPPKIVCVPQPRTEIMGDMVMQPVPDTIREIPVEALSPVPDTAVIMGKIKMPEPGRSKNP